MAEDNPKLEIKIPPKPIHNTREVFIAENEKNILGARGFKFSLGNDFSRKTNLYDRIKNSESGSKFNIDRTVLPDISNYYNNKNTSRLIKSRSLLNINNNNLKCLTNRENMNNYNNLKPKSPIDNIRYKNNSINSPNNNKYIFSSLSSPKSFNNITNFTSFSSTKNEELNSKHNLTKLRKNFVLKNINNSVPEKNINQPEDNLIKVSTLKKLRKYDGLNNLKKIRIKNNNVKSYFKGVESVFIYPEQIYPVLNDTKPKGKKDSFDTYENNIKEKIEKNNEYKEDQRRLLFEDQAKLDLVNSKEFYNILINREYYFKTQINKNNIFKQKDMHDEKNNLKKKLNYLKKIAFRNENILKRNNSIEYINENNNDTNKDNNENKETNTSGNELNKTIMKKGEDENIEKVRIDGKTYILKNQMEQIARKILNKCKVYNDK